MFPQIMIKDRNPRFSVSSYFKSVPKVTYTNIHSVIDQFTLQLKIGCTQFSLVRNYTSIIPLSKESEKLIFFPLALTVYDSTSTVVSRANLCSCSTS